MNPALASVWCKGEWGQPRCKCWGSVRFTREGENGRGLRWSRWEESGNCQESSWPGGQHLSQWVQLVLPEHMPPSRAPALAIILLAFPLQPLPQPLFFFLTGTQLRDNLLVTIVTGTWQVTLCFIYSCGLDYINGRSASHILEPLCHAVFILINGRTGIKKEFTLIEQLVGRSSLFLSYTHTLYLSLSLAHNLSISEALCYSNNMQAKSSNN